MRSSRLSWVVVAVIVMMLVLPLAVSAAPKESAGGSGCSAFYTVKFGDTLAKIARRFGTSVWHLAWLNGLANPNRIISGRVLCVSGHPGGHSHGGFRYTVKWGDTLGNIGWRFGWSAAHLAWVNGLANPNRIFPGQRLFIPHH